MRKKLLTIICLTTVFLSYAQEPLKHEKKMYISEDGKLFLNKSMPIYLWLSTSSDENAKKVRLKSEDSKKYTNPLYFDTEGINTVRTPSKVDTVTKIPVYPKEDIIFEVYVDGIPPRVTAKKTNSAIQQNGKTTYSNGNVNLLLKASDAVSGVDVICFSVNGEPFKPYSDTLKFSEEKEYIISYYAVDNVGNSSEIKKENFTIDNSSPRSEIILEGDVYENILSGNSKLTIKATDNASGVSLIQYKIDNGKYVSYTYPISTKWISEGEHTITYYSEDLVKNKEPEQTKTFFVDKTPPTVIDELVGNTYFVNGKEFSSGITKMKLVAMDNKAGIKEISYTTDGKNYEKYTSPFSLPSSKGLVSINYYAIDNVNNKSISNQQSDKSKSTYMDLSGPKLSFNFIGTTVTQNDTIFANNGIKIELKAHDEGAGVKEIKYILNGDAEKKYESPIGINNGGRYKITFTGYDNVNNVNQREFAFVVDTKGPEIFERHGVQKKESKDGLDVYPSHTALFLSATDEEVGYSKMYYSINGAEFSLYTNVISGFKKNSTYAVTVKAYDRLNNVSEKEIRFYTSD